MNYVRKPFILIMGKSGSGKTTETLLSKLPCVNSYTTRPARYEGETGHTFVTEEAFPPTSEQIAFTEFNGYKYCATYQQISDSALYVIDPDGAIEFIPKFHSKLANSYRQLICIYIETSPFVRFKRMVQRGDGIRHAIGRIKHDRRKFKSLNEIEKLQQNCFPPLILLKVKNNYSKKYAGTIAKYLNTIYNYCTNLSLRDAQEVQNEET